MKVLEFKRKTPDPLAVRVDVLNQEVLFHLKSLKTNKEVRDFLLLHLAQICYYIFETQMDQDPRTMLRQGVNRLYDRWCSSKKNTTKE